MQQFLIVTVARLPCLQNCWEQISCIRGYIILSVAWQWVFQFGLPDNISHFIHGVHFAGLIEVENILLADTGISRQTEGHSFCESLSSESAIVTPSSVIEASIVLFCLYNSCESMSNQPAH
jgi:hypothetical protein